MKRLLLMTAALLIGGCSNYDAEIGYFDGSQRRFDYWGNFSSLDDCRDAAIGRFNAMNSDKPVPTAPPAA